MPRGREQPEAGICLALNPAPLGMMQGYQGHDGEVKPLSGSLYCIGDVAAIDPDSYFTYLGREDDVFKASD